MSGQTLANVAEVDVNDLGIALGSERSVKKALGADFMTKQLLEDDGLISSEAERAGDHGVAQLAREDGGGKRATIESSGVPRPIENRDSFELAVVDSEFEVVAKIFFLHLKNSLNGTEGNAFVSHTNGDAGSDGVAVGGHRPSSLRMELTSASVWVGSTAGELFLISSFS